MSNPASFDDKHIHIFLFNTADAQAGGVTPAALNLGGDWTGSITCLPDERLSTDMISRINQALGPDDQAAVIVNAANVFCPYWLPRLLSGLDLCPESGVCSAATTRIYELSPLPEDLRFTGTCQQLDNALCLRYHPGGVMSVSRINPDALAVRVIQGVLPVSTFDEHSLHETWLTDNLLLQPGEGRDLYTENVPEIGDQHPLPAHPLRTFHHWLRPRVPLPDLAGYPGLDDKPVMLHISMDWGGGVNKWIDDYIATESDYHHVVLVSQGEFYRQRFGERLSLRWAGTNGVLLRRFDLTRPIAVLADTHEEYERMLEEVIRLFNVQKIIVSSVIGHGLACMRTGLPTVRLFHDYFPHWPLLDARLGGGPPDAEKWRRAFAESRHEAFGGLNEHDQKNWHQALLTAYGENNVALVAPSVSTVKNLKALGVPPGRKPAQVIPHAIGPLPFVEPEADQPFTVLLPGRVNTIKGQVVLEKLLSRLKTHLPNARVILLGAGKNGRQFADYPGVTVIEDYQPSQLADRLAQASPHVALLLSQAAETFSYTLSEMQQTGIPVVAVATGALAERIEHGKTGWLVPPESPESQAEHVLRHLKALAQEPAVLADARQALRRQKKPTVADMRAAYAKIWHGLESRFHARTSGDDPPTPGTLWLRYSQRQLADMNLRVQRQAEELRQQLTASESLVAERTRWAEQLQTHIGELKEAIASFKIQIYEQQQTIAEREKHIAAEQAENAHLQQLLQSEKDRLHDEIRYYEGQLRQLQGELAAVYSSTSWRITKPLRFARRTAGHIRRRLAYRASQIRGIPLRLVRSLKTRGARGAAALIWSRMRRQTGATDASPKHVEMETTLSPITLVTRTNPQASIIIPVYNHFEHTWNCLKSLSVLETQVPFEVIVVDDASSDQTPEKINLITGVRYHRQSENGGFIASCNTGAALATGEFLVFLNNDTIVQPGWLDALLDTFEQRPDCGLAGSRLLYPDGRLQEAGGIVFSDASGWNYGRLDQPDQPPFNHLRAVDYCSGASIAIRRDFFEQLGGFDSRYKPAYYEDTDLAFAVRRAGRQVYYQPESRVVHFEGVTSGTDISSGTKRYQAINRKKFAEKWADALVAQPRPGIDIELARLHGQPPRVLIADATTPTPDQDSGSVRMLNLIRILCDLGYHVVFMPENLAHAGDYTRRLEKMGVECLYGPVVKNPLDYLRNKGSYLDAVILSRYYVAEPLLPLVRHYAPQARVIFDTVDLHYVREARQAELEKSDKLARLAEKTRFREQSCIKQADLTWVVSPFEQELLQRDLPGAAVSVLSNIHDVHGCRAGFEQRRDLLFVGGFQHTPNVDAACWFVQEIWPLIRQRLPEVVFHLVGSKAPAAVRTLGDMAGVRFHGFVPDLEPLLDGCRVAVAPLRFGAGVKGKVNLSMSYGQPVVATAIATEGMYCKDGIDVLNADTPQAFAEAVVRVYQDPELWQRLSRNGLENVQRWFSFEAARRSVQQSMKG